MDDKQNPRAPSRLPGHRNWPHRERHAGEQVIFRLAKEMPAGTCILVSIDPNDRRRLLCELPDGVVGEVEQVG